jgi:hypothetical protein
MVVVNELDFESSGPSSSPRKSRYYRIEKRYSDFLALHNDVSIFSQLFKMIYNDVSISSQWFM